MPATLTLDGQMLLTGSDFLTLRASNTAGLCCNDLDSPLSPQGPASNPWDIPTPGLMNPGGDRCRKLPYETDCIPGQDGTLPTELQPAPPAAEADFVAEFEEALNDEALNP
jgi:hypothetical protein